MSSELPYRLFKKNRVASAIDEAILENFQKDARYHVIRKNIPKLRSSPKPKAFKEISKVLYVNRIPPPISKQGHDTKAVLGATGEAFTELLLPAEEVEVNNAGYDLKFDASLIEVKSTVADRVSMSNVQYMQADYLVIHVYHEHSDDYRFTYLIPMRILRIIKGQKAGRVTVNIYKETWVNLFKVTAIRLAQYFKIRRLYRTKDYKRITELRYKSLFDQQMSGNSVSVISLFNLYRYCYSWKWEMRYAYYEYFYNGRLTWDYTYNCLKDVYDIGLYAVYHDNQWKRRVVR
ncbi:hypothetical protein [Photobacterium leiognathi]|uniref:hypothetical protein n=1 Tax=Photobacterium leiognathi TaxID=553611 RepID=UPI0029828C5A|nr:hypothetical protein [Photobacterium leiognathi]